MSVKPPVLPKALCKSILEADLTDAVEGGESVYAREYEDSRFEVEDAPLIEFNQCIFRRIRFTAGDIDRIHFLDCRFESCDFSGFHFRSGTVRRCVFINCRGMGAGFSGMILRDVLFDCCALKYASFADCKITDAAFKECALQNILLHRCAQSGLILENCNMESGEIIETKLSGTDLSSCQIDGIRSSIQCFSGTQMSILQASCVFSLCGITLKG